MSPVIVRSAGIRKVSTTKFNYGIMNLWIPADL